MPDGSKRETNTMPQWAGSCWYYLRFVDSTNSRAMIDAGAEKYWMGTKAGAPSKATPGVDLYVGGTEHAVLHLLYSRFWHKVLFDLGHVSTSEPFMKLVNQGTILGEAEFWTLEVQSRRVEESEVEKVGEGYRLKSNPSIKVEAQ